MPDPESPQRRVILVVGADPGAVGPVAAALAALGAGDLTSGEAGRWVGDLHRDLLERCGVETDDARPAAWFETGKLSANGITRGRLTEWLGRQFVHPPDHTSDKASDKASDKVGQPRPDVVVADPGLPWLLGLWRAAALRCDAEVAQVIVVTPAPGDDGGAAAWLNRMLHVERATRGGPRAVLPWADVAADWTVPFVALGRDLGLSSVQEATANQIRRAHDAVANPGAAPDEVAGTAAVPTLLHDLVEATTAALATGAEPDQDALDALREGYRARYAAAEAVTGSSVRAALRTARATTAAPPDAEAGGVGDRARRGVRRALGR